MREIIKEEVKEAVGGQTSTWSALGGIKSGCSAVLGGMSTFVTTSGSVLTSTCAPVVSGLNGREKVALTALGAYAVYKYWPSLSKLIPTRKVKTILNLATPLGSREYIHESVREGSPELKLSMPKCQIPVGHYSDGVFRVHGNAVRLEDWLLVPDHVLQQEEFAHVRLSNGKFFDLKAVEERFAIETDVFAVRLTPAVMSQLGVQKVVLQHEHSDQGIGVSVVGAQGLGTTGILTPGSFGRVIYSGTTRGGYSGSAYMQGSRIVGIHLHGGKVNGGFSISYLWCNLKYELQQIDESSEEFLSGLYKSQARVEVDPAWYDLDTKRIRSKGRYHIVSVEAWDKVFKTDPRPPVKYYDDFDQLSESLGFHDRLALNTSKPGQGQVSSELPLVTKQLMACSAPRLKLIKQILNGTVVVRENTSGQLAQQKKNTTASSSTPTVI